MLRIRCQVQTKARDGDAACPHGHGGPCVDHHGLPSWCQRVGHPDRTLAGPSGAPRFEIPADLQPSLEASLAASVSNDAVDPPRAPPSWQLIPLLPLPLIDRLVCTMFCAYESVPQQQTGDGRPVLALEYLGSRSAGNSMLGSAATAEPYEFPLQDRENATVVTVSAAGGIDTAGCGLGSRAPCATIR